MWVQHHVPDIIWTKAPLVQPVASGAASLRGSLSHLLRAAPELLVTAAPPEVRPLLLIDRAWTAPTSRTALDHGALDLVTTMGGPKDRHPWLTTGRLRQDRRVGPRPPRIPPGAVEEQPHSATPAGTADQMAEASARQSGVGGLYCSVAASSCASHNSSGVSGSTAGSSTTESPSTVSGTSGI